MIWKYEDQKLILDTLAREHSCQQTIVNIDDLVWALRESVLLPNYIAVTIEWSEDTLVVRGYNAENKEEKSPWEFATFAPVPIDQVRRFMRSLSRTQGFRKRRQTKAMKMRGIHCWDG